MKFNEANTVEAFIRDLLCGGVTHYTAVGPGLARKAGKISGAGWHYLAAANIPRLTHEVFVESFVQEALSRLNPEIAAAPERADEVLYKLRAIVLAVRSDGLVKANEEFTSWLRGDRSMPFGENHQHVPVRMKLPGARALSMAVSSGSGLFSPVTSPPSAPALRSAALREAHRGGQTRHAFPSRHGR